MTATRDSPGATSVLGHASVQTTEIYSKELIPETVRPNETTIVGSRK
jgi:hypothetical protein